MTYLSNLTTQIQMQDQIHNLVLSFIQRNPSWSIDSMYVYCMRQYKNEGITNEIFSNACKAFINSKTQP